MRAAVASSVAAIVIGGLIGCSSQSDGVEHSASETIPLDSVWTLKSDLLHRVSTLALTHNHLIVGNAGSGQLIAVNLAGGDASVLGRAGRGPGEYSSITDVAVRADTVFLIDALSGRLSAFVIGDTSTVSSQWALPPRFGEAKRLFVRATGEIVIAFRSGAPKPGTVPDLTVVRDSVRVVLLNRDAVERSTVLFSFPGDEYFYGVTTDGKRWLGKPAFATASFYDMFDDGLVVADGRTGVVSVWDWGGTSRIVRGSDNVGADLVSQGEIDALVGRLESKAERLMDGAEYRELALVGLRVWAGAPPRPHYRDLSSNGRTVALQNYESGIMGANTWVTFDVDGKPLGTWVVPMNVRLMTLVADTVLAISADSLDVESLLMMRVKRNLAER